MIYVFSRYLIFDKAYQPNCSTKIFSVGKVQYTNATTYLLGDVNKKVYWVVSTKNNWRKLNIPMSV